MDAIRSAIRKYNALGNWPWERQEIEITTTNGTESYTVPQAVKKELGLYRLDSSGGRRDQRLAFVPYETYIEAYSVNCDSTPWCYTVNNLFETGQILLYPRPVSTEYLLFLYGRETPRPRLEDDPVEFPDWASEGYMSEAWYEFLKRLPQDRRPSDLGLARLDAERMRRRMMAFINSPGDTVGVP